MTKKHAPILLGALALVAALVWFFLGDRIAALVHAFEWSKFGAAFGQFDPAWLWVAAGLIMITYPGRAVRWAALIRPICPRPHFLDLTRAQFTGFMAVALFGRPGELVRPWLIARQQKLSFSSQMAVWFLERIFDLLAVLALFGFALVRIDPATANQVGPAVAWVLRAGGGVAAGIALVACALIIAFRFFSEHTRHRLTSVVSVLPEPLAGRASGAIDAFLEGISSMKSTPQILWIFALSFLEWVIIVGTFYALFRGFGPTAHLTFTDAMIAVGFVAFGGIVQIPGIGGGVQVVTILVLRELYGVELEQATVMALVVWAITFLISVPFGIAFAIHDGVNWKNLRHVPQE